MVEAERTEDSPDAGRLYRFEHLAVGIVMKDMYFSKADPGPGDRAPDFDLPTLGGGRFRSADLGETGPALLIFGSYTCPVTENAAPGLKELHGRFGDRVRFVMVDVREAHPGKAVTQPKRSTRRWRTRNCYATSTALNSRWRWMTSTALSTAPWAQSPTQHTFWARMGKSCSARNGLMTPKP